MFVLCQLKNRAETTDTLIFLVSDNLNTVQEYLLSIYDEIIQYEPDQNTCIEYLKTFHIVRVPYLGD